MLAGLAQKILTGSLTIVLFLHCAPCATAQDHQVLLFGDSITQGFARDAHGNTWGISTPPRGQRVTWWGYGMYLEELIKDRFHVHSEAYNWGYGGLRSDQALYCEGDWDCIDAVLQSRDADLILIMLGANDLYSGLSHTATRYHLSIMLDKSLEQGIQPILGAITPNTRMSGYNDKIYRQYNPLLKELAQEKGVPWADHYTALIAQWDTLYSSGDGLHLGDEGNQKLAQTWYESIENIRVKWKTEIGLINPLDVELTAILHGFDAHGGHVWSQAIALPGLGRLEMDVAQAAGIHAPDIKSMRLDISSGQALGYQKLYQAAKFRAGLPASARASQESLYVPHIASNDEWHTDIGWTNTTQDPKELQFNFDNGEQAVKPLEANGQETFTIASLFAAVSRPDLGAADVTNASGMTGALMFGQDDTLAGINLSDDAEQELFFPHVVQDQDWWTGLVVYNPGSNPADLRIGYLDTDGNMLGEGRMKLESGGKWAGSPLDLGFPNGTQWFSVQSSQPVTGFELLGAAEGNRLGGFSIVNLATTSGVLPKLEPEGWTGIACVNTEDAPAEIWLEARNDAGQLIASHSFTLNANAKRVDMAEAMFAGQDIASATYLRFTAEKHILCFQLNASEDNTMLDGLPALGSRHTGTYHLFFPHVHADNIAPRP